MAPLGRLARVSLAVAAAPAPLRYARLVLHLVIYDPRLDHYCDPRLDVIYDPRLDVIYDPRLDVIYDPRLAPVTSIRARTSWLDHCSLAQPFQIFLPLIVSSSFYYPFFLDVV
jgi:hypothetical protein